MKWRCLSLLAAVFISGASSVLLASSRLTKCVQTETGREVGATDGCKMKFVVTLSANFGQNGTESVEVLFDEAVDDDGNTVEIQQPWSITLRMTDGYLRYPTEYLQTFNGGPGERSIQLETVSRFNVFDDPNKCVDAPSVEDVTCGCLADSSISVQLTAACDSWARTSAGAYIDHSQGFCCECSLAQTLGSDSSASRSNLDCNVAGQVFGGADAESAHCLRWGSTWYQSFELRAPETYFTAYVDVWRPAVATGEYATERLVLGPDYPGAQTVDNANNNSVVIARLIGSLKPPQDSPILSPKLLLIPQAPDSLVDRGLDSWLVMDKTMFSMDGTECNKIGVSYEAFANQARRCEMPIGSCLNSQIDDFDAADQERAREGRSPKYHISRWGECVGVITDDFLDAGLGFRRYYLAYKILQRQAQIFTLEFVADDIQFVLKKATGRIVTAVIKTFEAQSYDGIMEVVVMNTGGVIAEFTVAVNECSTGVMRVPAQTRSIRAGATEPLDFEIRTDHEEALEAQHCTCTLLDSEMAVVDTMVVQFNTTETQLHLGAQAGEEAEGAAGGETRSFEEKLGCSDYCPQFYSILCFFAHGCWEEFFMFLLIVVGVLAFIALMWKTKCCVIPVQKCANKHEDKQQAEDEKRQERQDERDDRKRARKRGLSKLPQHDTEMYAELEAAHDQQAALRDQLEALQQQAAQSALIRQAAQPGVQPIGAMQSADLAAEQGPTTPARRSKATVVQNPLRHSPPTEQYFNINQNASGSLVLIEARLQPPFSLVGKLYPPSRPSGLHLTTLRADSTLAPQFEQRYGPGSASAVLSGQGCDELWRFEANRQQIFEWTQQTDQSCWTPLRNVANLPEALAQPTFLCGEQVRSLVSGFPRFRCVNQKEAIFGQF